MYIDIFNEVVDIMQNDYAGYKDKQGWDFPDKYRENIQKLSNQRQIDDYTFINIVNDYLLDFKDPHMFFIAKDEHSKTNKDIGFKVRRFNDVIYVTEVMSETRLKVGDRIIALDNLAVSELSLKHKRELRDEIPERQRWESIIEKYDTVYVKNNNQEVTSFNLKLYEKQQYTAIHSLEKLNHNTLNMTLTDFFTPDSIEKILKDNKIILSDLENLIIDVRKNRGGSDTSFEQLLPLLFPKGKTILNLDNYKMDFNITKRTADLQIKGLKSLQDKTTDTSFKESLDNMITFFQDNSGKGFVSFENGGEFEVEGSEFPKNIIVLADVYCGSAGDIFVDIASRSAKVAVIGRPTAGLNDYSNLINKDWDEKFSLYYPTSRMVSLDEGIKDTGVKPNTYVKWTPEHLQEDIDIVTAVNSLKAINNK